MVQENRTPSFKIDRPDRGYSRSQVDSARRELGRMSGADTSGQNWDPRSTRNRVLGRMLRLVRGDKDRARDREERT